MTKGKIFPAEVVEKTGRTVYAQNTCPQVLRFWGKTNDGGLTVVE
jgi:hypothetical protein